MIKEENAQWQAVIDQVYQNGQGHIFKYWSWLSSQDKHTFIEQLARIDWPQINRLIDLALNPQKKVKQKIEPVEVITLKDRQQRDARVLPLGERALRDGKVGVCLVAGGQGSRLGFDGPKGCFPITPVQKKSLFQLHAEKIKAVSLKYGITLPWYIMTSRSNNDATIEFFRANRYFGLGKENVFFFIQEMIPAVDRQGKFILESKNRIFESPNGHGGVIKALWESGAIDDMKCRGIDYLFYFQVDNVLVKMCDPVFIGYHIEERAQMSNKVVRKVSPEDRVGVICKIGNKVGVVEYSDLDAEHMYARNDKGELIFWAGSIAIHVLDVAFLEQENKNGFKLPFHVAEKAIPYLNERGELVKPREKNGFKFETFIFDALLDAQKTCTIEVDRLKEFSAVKNKEGFESPQTARDDLMRNYALWLKNAGIDVPLKNNSLPLYPLEISPLFALDEEDVKLKKDKIPPISGPAYIE